MSKGPVLSRSSDLPILLAQDVEKTAWNIKQALLTPLGSRPNLPNFGSKLHLLQFNLMSDFFLDLCKVFINEAVTTSIPDVTLKRIEAEIVGPKDVSFQIMFVDNKTRLFGTLGLDFNNGQFSI